MTAAQVNFIEGMGRQFEADGLPRIAGRMFGFTLLEDQPCSLDDFAEQLQISKTSASTNARLLEQAGLIERVTKPGDRKDYYRAAPDQTRTLEVRLEGVRRMASLLHEGREALPSGRPAAARRLDQMMRFNDEAYDILVDLLESWKKRREG
jgi:DNA-binding transcriptional regulator GbsR (MarR family)